MGETSEEDRQRMKRIAAAAYDYENDPRWADYWSNILIPPHMASRSEVVDHFKRKFYQRYIDPELVVETMSSNSLPNPSRPSAPSSTSSNDQARPRNSESTTRTSGMSASTSPNPTSLRWDRQTIQFSMNAWVFVVAVLAIFPLVPRNLSQRAYRLSFMGTACSCLYSVYSLYGKPRAWNLQALQVYFQSIFATKDFIYFIYCLTFFFLCVCVFCSINRGLLQLQRDYTKVIPQTDMSSCDPSDLLYNKIALIPILCRSIEHVAKFLRRNFSRSSLYRKYLEEPCVWVESNTTTLCIVSSNAEIGLGFLLIISLLSWQRNLIQTFMYWQLLKLMHQAPVTASYHNSIWAKIGRTVNPLVGRYAPFLNTPISVAQRWWFR